MKPQNETANRLQHIHALQSELTSSPYSHDILELALATATSFQLSHRGELPPVWLLIVGAPSSDKTNTMLFLRNISSIHFVDTLTENAIASGFVDERGRSKRHDLLSKVKTGCVALKDLTTLFSLRHDKIKKILGKLQSVFDGDPSRASPRRAEMGRPDQEPRWRLHRGPTAAGRVPRGWDGGSASWRANGPFR